MTGKDLKNKLELMGIPLRQVAELLCISEQNLQNKMSSADIKVSFLCKISKVLHKSIYYFLDGQDFYEEKLVTFNSSKLDATPNDIIPDSSISLRLMDKLDEKDIENKSLNFELRAMAEELATLKECLRHLEPSTIRESNHRSMIEEVIEAFTEAPSGGSAKDSEHTRNPTTFSKKSSAGKT